MTIATGSATGSEAPRRARLMHPKRLAKMTAAIAGLTCSLSVLVGVIAARAAPHGLRGIAFSLHLARQPLIVKVATGIATVAVIAAAVSGLLHFYTWWQEHEVE
jgi:hypothetical protein